MQISSWTWWEWLALILIGINWFAVTTYGPRGFYSGHGNKRWAFIIIQPLLTFLVAVLLYGAGLRNATHIEFGFFLFAAALIWNLRALGDIKGLTGMSHFTDGGDTTFNNPKYWTGICVCILAFTWTIWAGFWSEDIFINKAVTAMQKKLEVQGDGETTKAVIVTNVTKSTNFGQAAQAPRIIYEVKTSKGDAFQTELGEAGALAHALDNMVGRYHGISRHSVFLLEHRTEGSTLTNLTTLFH